MKERYTLIKHARLVKMQERRIEECDILVRHGAGNEKNTIAAVEKSIDRKSLTDCTLTLVDKTVSDQKPKNMPSVPANERLICPKR